MSLIRALALTLLSSVLVAQTPTAARIVAWQPKPGMEKQFEEGYKRHLEWHRQNHDSWTWLGWFISGGDRVGTFVDGTFFHPWADLDSPIAPAADSADNAANVYPYANIRSVATYELVPAATNLDPKGLTSPLMHLVYLDVAPGSESGFEALAAKTLSADNAPRHALFAPANGEHRYLLFLTATKPSELELHQKVIRALFQATANASKPGTPMLRAYRSELARYRADMSYSPGSQ